MKPTTKIIAAVAATVVAGGGRRRLCPSRHRHGLRHGLGGMGPGTGHGSRHGTWGPGMGGGSGHGPPGPAGHDMAAAAASRAAHLKTQLKITRGTGRRPGRPMRSLVTQQAAAMQAMRDQFHAQVQNAQPGARRTDIAAQRQSMIALREANQAAHSAALKDLYAVLTPEQQTIADRNLSWRPHRMQGRLAPR